jgi:polysaccharide export outer membrane protein
VTAYKKYFKDPQVTVEVTDFRSQPVSVAGNVNTPGVVQLRGTRNLMEVIGMAGGLKPDAGDSVLITRYLNEGSIPVAGAFVDATGKYSVAHVDIRAVMERQGSAGQHPDQAARCHYGSPGAHDLRAGQRGQAGRVCA